MANIPFVYEALDQLLDAGKVSPLCENCCPCNNIYVFASIETFIELADALGWTNINNTCPIESWTVNCCTEDCYDKISAKYGDTVTGTILDKGIAEYSLLTGRSMLCEIYDSLILNNVDNADDAAAIIDNILDKGIVFACSGNDQIYGSVETYIKWAEGVGKVCVNAPVCSCVPEEKCCYSVRASVDTALRLADAFG